MGVLDSFKDIHDLKAVQAEQKLLNRQDSDQYESEEEGYEPERPKAAGQITKKPQQQPYDSEAEYEQPQESEENHIQFIQDDGQYKVDSQEEPSDEEDEYSEQQNQYDPQPPKQPAAIPKRIESDSDAEDFKPSGQRPQDSDSDYENEFEEPRGASELMNSNKSSSNPAPSQKPSIQPSEQEESSKPEYEKKFTGNIIGLDSEPESSRKGKQKWDYSLFLSLQINHYLVI